MSERAPPALSGLGAPPPGGCAGTQNHDRAGPAPREWQGDWPCPWPATRSLPDGAEVRACFCVVALQLARTRHDQPYLRLTLSDRYGPVEARLWEEAEAAASALRPGSFIGVHGRLEHFNGELQISIESFEPLQIELADLPLFLPRSARPQSEMESELEQMIESVQDQALRQLLRGCLDARTDVGSGFRLAPAAKHNHHAYLGGLLEHTLSVAALCDLLAGHYGPRIDRDLLVGAALLHDIGKVREIGARAGFPYTDEGKLLGHVLLGLELVTTAARAVPALSASRLLLLQHLIASHQGRYEWQSPREPATLEAIILHYADDLDAKLQQVRELIEHGDGPWTAYDRSFRREFLRHLGTTDPAVAAPGPATEEVIAELPVAAPVARPKPEKDSPPNLAVPASPGGVRGESRHRAPRSHGPTGFHKFSEDTLDLFGAGPQP